MTITLSFKIGTPAGGNAPVYTAAPSFILSRPPPTLAEQLLANETAGMAASFIDIVSGQALGSMQIKDTVTPANNFIASSFDGGTPFTKFQISRTGRASCFNSAGVMTEVAAGTPRIDFDPATLLPRGLMVEEGATNILLNSLIDGTPLATQSVVLSGTSYFLSFYGTGSITPSGAGYAGGAITGSAFPARTVAQLTGLTNGGTLTLTVTGDVRFAQLEAVSGSGPTSFIPTAAAAQNRGREMIYIPSTVFQVNPAEGTLYVEAMFRGVGAAGVQVPSSATEYIAYLGNDTTNYISIMKESGGTSRPFAQDQVAGNAEVAMPAAAGGGFLNQTPKKAAYGWAANDCAIVNAGAAPSTDPTKALFAGDYNRLQFGRSVGQPFIGWIRTIMLLPRRMTNAQMQTLTS